MQSLSLRLTAWFLGFGAGSLVGLFVPALHAPHFLRRALAFESFFGAVWEYELWGNVAGIIAMLLASPAVGLRYAGRFGLGYALAFSVLIFARNPNIHYPWTTTSAALLAVVVVLLVAKSLALATTFCLAKLSLDHHRWATWSLPTKLSLVLGAVGALGFVFGLMAWFGVRAEDILPGMEYSRSAILRFPYGPHVVELHGTDGSTFESPIKIIGARQSQDGVRAQAFWLNTYYPHHEPVMQGLLVMPGRADVTEIETVHPDGSRTRERSVTTSAAKCFDVVVLENWLGLRTSVYFEISNVIPCEEASKKNPKIPR